MLRPRPTTTPTAPSAGSGAIFARVSARSSSCSRSSSSSRSWRHSPGSGATAASAAIQQPSRLRRRAKARFLKARSATQTYAFLRVQGQTRREAGTQSYGARTRAGRVATRSQRPTPAQSTEAPVREERGFTLIEVLVVILVIGVLAAIALPIFTHKKDLAYDSDAKSNARNLVSYMDSCYVWSENFTKCQTQADTEARDLDWGSGPGQVRVTDTSKD